MPVFSKERWTLIALVAAALLIGLLSAPTRFRSDEIWSLNAVAGSHAAMLAILRADIHPPLFYELLFVWTRIFGTSEIRRARTVRALDRDCDGRAVSLDTQVRLGIIRRPSPRQFFLSSPLANLGAQLGRMYAAAIAALDLSRPRSTGPYSVRRKNFATLTPAMADRSERLGTFTHIWFIFLLFAECLHWLFFVRARSAVRSPACSRRRSCPTRSCGCRTDPPDATISGALGVGNQTRRGRKSAITLFVYIGTLLIFSPFPVWMVFAPPRPARRVDRWIRVPARGGLDRAVCPLLRQAGLLSALHHRRLHLFAIAVAGCIARVSNGQVAPMLCAMAAASSIYGVAFPGKCDARWGAGYVAKRGRRRRHHRFHRAQPPAHRSLSAPVRERTARSRNHLPRRDRLAHRLRGQRARSRASQGHGIRSRRARSRACGRLAAK
jgi:hypothetical protein